MVFTLHRYVFRELLKVFLLAAIALTLILSLGSILQPVQQQGVGPRQVLHLIVYFLPITLTFVLPMAALFASALVYGRFASDNELDACRASGVSLMTIIYPGLALAIAVAIANLLLSFHVMPYFVHLAEKSLKADAKQILFRNIERRGYYEVPDDRHYIYADDVSYENDALLGIVVAEIEAGQIGRIITAESARITFQSRGQFNEVHIAPYRVAQIGTMDAQGFTMGGAGFLLEFGSLLGDAIKFKKVEQMKAIRARLTRFYPIARIARETYAQIMMELLAREIRSTLDRSPDSLYRLYSGAKSVRFTADRCEVHADGTILLADNVTVMEQDLNEDTPPRTFHCPTAVLQLDVEGLTPTLMMHLSHPRIEETGELPMTHIVRGLVVPASVEEITHLYKSRDNALLARKLAEPVPQIEDPSPELERLRNDLNYTILKTLARIRSEMHSRLSFGIGCIPMILIGIGLGIIKRGGHLLTAFGASCIPAAVLIVCIMSGKNVAENLGSNIEMGIIVMWAGVGFLATLTALVYHRLLRT